MSKMLTKRAVGKVALTVTAILGAIFGPVTSRGLAQQSIPQIVSYVKPAVVFIVSATNSGAKSGTGFVLSSDAASSVIVTANHVVEGATEVDVLFDSSVQERYQATVLHRDHVRDVAILTVQIGNRRTLQLENTSSVSEGTAILIVGYPRASLQFFRRIEGDDLRPSVHSGIVSAIRLNGEIIQFDAAVDHGDSGGPILDAANGKVIAIVRGTPLDPSYASRGMEQALPGSAYGPSADTIRTVVGNSGTGGLPAAAPGAADVHTQAVASDTNSASYRVGYGIPHEAVTGQGGEEINSSVNSSVLGRLTDFLRGDNSLYLIPLQLSADALSDSQHLAGYCEDNRLNAIVAPAFAWRLTGGPRYNAYGSLLGYSGTASVSMRFVVFDCYGEPFFADTKTKAENRYFAHRTPDREIVDMANDLLDQLTAELSRAQTERQGQWSSLLKIGIALDPADDSFHSLLFFVKKPEGWRVGTVVPGGPADKAGIRQQDIVLQVNDLEVSGMTLAQLLQQLNAPTYKITLQRPGGPTTVVVNPIHYVDVVRLVQH
jgi:S1-C subfamily serine protease